MDKEPAKNLVKNTFENPFNKEQFVNLIKNLLNEFKEKPFICRGNYIHRDFSDSIKTLERIGKYRDSEEKTLDILIVQLKNETTLDRARTKQRNYIAKYLKGSRGGQLKDGALVAFVSPNQENWRFSFIKMEYKFDEKGKVQEEFTPARRYSFLVGQNEKSHTAQSKLLPLLQNDKNPTLEDLENAFSVEKVTKEFFEKYRELFHKLTDALNEIIKKDKKIKKDFESKNIQSADFTKKLLGQIVFLYFLQKKGWFGVKRGKEWGTGSKSFLRELFNRRFEISESMKTQKEKDVIQSHSKNKNENRFFNDVLEPLFYEALQREREDDYYSRFDCRIPFLNGGLFDPVNSYDWVNTEILLPDSLFSNQNLTGEGDIGDGILDIFDRYNFTVKEDEPLEKEVAVDPEMLGKVFENLLEEIKRKKQGAYYTPREIVHYMCQESLINYLATELKNKVSKEDIERLVRHGESTIENESHILKQEKETDTYSFKLSENIRNYAEIIDQKLKDIRVCDPAVGSGAFIVGMMTEIVRSRNTLTPHISNKKERTSYNFKRYAIEHCLYGVDIDPGAIEIEKLRLWLSLVVDEEERETIQPLPNLDYKIVSGNSLLSVEIDLSNQEQFKKLERLKSDYFNETRIKEKEKYRQQIDHLIKEIIEKVQFNEKIYREILKLEALFSIEKNSKKKQEYEEKIKQLKNEMTKGQKNFDFKIHFSEVFHKKQGFDVVIANPPYVQLQKEDGKLANLYESQNYDTFTRTGDIYVLFYEKSLNILRQNGILSFITSNKWMRADYGKKLRDYFSSNTQVLNLLDMGSDVFDEATVDTNILLVQNTKAPLSKSFRAMSMKNSCMGEIHGLGNNNNLAEYLKQHGIEMLPFKKEDLWIIIDSTQKNIKSKIEKIGIPLEKWDISINYGIKTGFNKAFIIDDEIKEKLIREDSKSSEIIKPVLKGKNVGRYNVSWKNLWLIDTHNGYDSVKPIDINKYTPIRKHLDCYSLKINNRQDKGLTPYNLRNCAYHIEFEKEKIIFQEIVQKPSFAYDEKSFFCIDTARIITGKNLKFLLSILNSKLFFYSIKHFYSGGGLGNKGVRMKHTFFKNFPVPQISKKEQKPLIDFVDKILALTKAKNYQNDQEKQKRVSKYETQIDQLVYKLYDFTEEEIKIVEDS